MIFSIIPKIEPDGRLPLGGMNDPYEEEDGDPVVGRGAVDVCAKTIAGKVIAATVLPQNAALILFFILHPHSIFIYYFYFNPIFHDLRFTFHVPRYTTYAAPKNLAT
jgi:hypothetical protein